MPRPFFDLSVEDFADLLHNFPWKRTITEVHLHHTWRPNHADFYSRPPIQSIEGMYNYHTTQAGFSDIAQHVTIDPNGTIWTGRNWNNQPASATGFNGNATAGPFMIEMIGDFDRGRDKWEGPQRDTAIQAVAIVQKVWGLPAEAFRFHNEMSSKSCPGTALDKAMVLDLIRKAQAKIVLTAGIDGGRSTVEKLLRQFSVNPESRALFNEGELPESTMNLREVALLNGARGAQISASREADARDLTNADLDRLAKHVINLRMGTLSSGGVFQSSDWQVKAIFEEHIPRFMQTSPNLRLVFFAHGGLNSEVDSLKTARNRIDYYLENHCYPIFFVWETGVKETLFDILGNIVGSGSGRGILDNITNASDAALEVAFRSAGASMWANMKLSAERAFLVRQGGTLVVEQLTKFWLAHSTNMEIHAIGHSAGSIFHAYFLSLLCQQPTNPQIRIKTLHYLAPAITVGLFKDMLMPLVGGRIEKLTMYTMANSYELNDAVGPYRKSLLYLVSRSFEDRPQMPILGLEDSVRRDPDLMRFFGLFGNKRRGEVLFSVQDAGPSNSTIAQKHGDFDNDRRTMEGVIRRILAVGDDEPVFEFPETVTRNVLNAPPVAATPVQPAAPAIVIPLPTGRRKALCIGIDDYAPPNRLSGCVNDANDWAATLRALGFEVLPILKDRDATWQNIRDSLQSLVIESRAGDALVVQYAGHGTRVDDLDGDESGGRDSALCPVDFPDGGFLIDDDVRAIFANLPNGVSLTCFFDCCHSGTITRFLAPTPARLPGVNIRGFQSTPALENAHREFRARLGPSHAVPAAPTAVPRGPSTMREVSFTACTDVQTAKEFAGHGEYTLRALRILSRGIGGLTNAAFRDQVRTAFLESTVQDQTPGLDCATAAESRLLFTI